MKLEVGMYVRTEYGIEKIVKIKESCTFAGFEEIINTDKNEYRDFIEHSKIKKASHNIIDLIEVGDYVNGYLITTISEEYGTLFAEDNAGYLLASIYEKQIYSIVTKEQFEQMEYKVGE